MNAQLIPEIETPRLTLTLPGADAASRMVAYFERNREHLAPWEPPFTRAMFTAPFWERRLVQNRTEFRSRQSMRLAMFAKGDPHQHVLGMTNFTRFTHGVFMACTVGYSIDQEAQGKGLMTEALRSGIDYAFSALGMHRVMANYIPTNERSSRVLRRLGFVVEGYARDYLYINGAWRDHVLTSLTNHNAPTPEYVLMAQSDGPKGRR